MAFIRYRKIGNNEYAYSVQAYWDSTLKKSRQKTTYLGIVVDKDKGIYKNPRKDSRGKELILDFGDTFIIDQTLKKSPLYQVIRHSFGSFANEILALSYYKLCSPGAMSHAYNFYKGNYINQVFPDLRIKSQRISEILKTIGAENVMREFFTQYIKTVTDKENGLIIDSTALPNHINTPFSMWSHTDNNIEMSIKFLFVTTKEFGHPLYFRYLPGSIPDVSLVTNTLQELKFFGVKSSFALLDAGFYSSENITKLNEADLAFLTRLPSSRKIFKQLITEVAPTIEKAQNATKYNNRILFVKHQEVEIDDMHLNAYVILDPIRKQRETSKLLSNLLEDDLIDDNTDNALLSKGIFILISSDTIETTQVVPLYYKRQKVEELFGIAKDDIDILPLRIHSESTLRGYLLINFIALSIYVLLNTALGNKYRLEETLSIMRNLKCKIYNDNFLVSERTKQQREILEHLEIQHLENLVPKTPGI